MLVTAFAFPDVERRAPVAVAAYAPILHVFKPIAEASFADRRRNPVDLRVVFKQVVFDGRHLDEPRFAGVVNQRGVATPTMRVAVLERRSFEQLARSLQVLKNQRVGVLNERARPFGLGSHVALAVDELHERNIVFAADAVIVFAEGGRAVDNTGAVLGRYVIVAGDVMRRFARLCNNLVGERIQRLVFAILKLRTLATRQNFAFAVNAVEDFINQRLGKDISRVADLNLDVIDFRVDAQAKV